MSKQKLVTVRLAVAYFNVLSKKMIVTLSQRLIMKQHASEVSHNDISVQVNVFIISNVYCIRDVGQFLLLAFTYFTEIT